MGTQVQRRTARDWREMAARLDRKRGQTDTIVNVKMTLLLKLAKEWLFYFVVYSIMTLVVNLSLMYMLISQNWRLLKISFVELRSFVQKSVLNYRRFFENYFHKLNLVLNATSPAELENLNFSISNQTDRPL